MTHRKQKRPLVCRMERKRWMIGRIGTYPSSNTQLPKGHPPCPAAPLVFDPNFLGSSSASPGSQVIGHSSATGYPPLHRTALSFVQNDGIYMRVHTVSFAVVFERQLLSHQSKPFIGFLRHGQGQMRTRIDAPDIFVLIVGSHNQETVGKRTEALNPKRTKASAEVLTYLAGSP